MLPFQFFNLPHCTIKFTSCSQPYKLPLKYICHVSIFYFSKLVLKASKWLFGRYCVSLHWYISTKKTWLYFHISFTQGMIMWKCFHSVEQLDPKKRFWHYHNTKKIIKSSDCSTMCTVLLTWMVIHSYNLVYWSAR